MNMLRWVVAPVCLYHTKCNYRRECIILAIVIMFGNNILALCILGNDGDKYGFAKMNMYLNDNNHIRYGTFTLGVASL